MEEEEEKEEEEKEEVKDSVLWVPMCWIKPDIVNSSMFESIGHSELYSSLSPGDTGYRLPALGL